MRYMCDFRRAGKQLDTDNRQQAENWLREQFSEGAVVLDKETGETGHILASGQIQWCKQGQLPDRLMAHHVPMKVELPPQPALRQTRTFAVMLVTKATYDEIHKKLAAAGYTHSFQGKLIDMHGIALEQER